MSLICVSSLEPALSSYLKMAKVELGRENEGTLAPPLLQDQRLDPQRDNAYVYLLIRSVHKVDDSSSSRLILSPFFWTYFFGTPSFLFFVSYFFGTPSFFFSSLWVMLLWHAIFPKFFRWIEIISLGLEHLFCEMNKQLCTRTESEK